MTTTSDGNSGSLSAVNQTASMFGSSRDIPTLDSILESMSKSMPAETSLHQILSIVPMLDAVFTRQTLGKELIRRRTTSSRVSVREVLLSDQDACCSLKPAPRRSNCIIWAVCSIHLPETAKYVHLIL